jgi:hypothetical protein
LSWPLSRVKANAEDGGVSNPGACQTELRLTTFIIE